MSRISGAGSFGNGPNIYDESTTEFDEDARRTLDGLGPAKPKLTAEQVKQAFEEAQRADEARTIKSQSADEFVALHSEFLDTPNNGTLMSNMLKNLFGDCAYTVEQFEAAYQALLVTDSLDIDKAEVAKQQQKAADAQRKAILKRRADAAARAFNPNANYEEMSLEELRNRANEEIQLGGQQEGAAGF